MFKMSNDKNCIRVYIILSRNKNGPFYTVGINRGEHIYIYTYNIWLSLSFRGGFLFLGSI